MGGSKEELVSKCVSKNVLLWTLILNIFGGEGTERISVRETMAY